MATMIWKFVDSPVSTPATLFDMNNGIDVLLDMTQEFDISPPQQRKTKSDSKLSAGSLITNVSYENRFLKFSLGLLGTKTNKMNNLAAFVAELSKPTNLIMYRPDSTKPPVFFRTYQGDDYIIRNSGGSAEVWGVDVLIEAEPFGIGIRQDLSTITVNNDPAASSGNKTFFDLTGILGDVPTKPFVRVGSIGSGQTFWLAQRAFNNPTSLTLFTQAEAATLGPDTTAIAGSDSSSVSPGTGNSKTQTTFSTNNNFTARLTFNAPTGTDSIAYRGRYRVVARIAASAAINVSMRWKQSNGGDVIAGPQTSVDLTTIAIFQDLGIIEYPAPQQPPQYIGYSGLPTQHVLQPLLIEAKRNSGTGNLLIDYVYLLPADERLCVVFQLNNISSGYVCLDGPNDAVYGMQSGSTPFGSTRIIDNQQGIITRFGGLPVLVPNITNRWYMLFNPSGNNVTRTVDISYWPRWREVAMI
jgi:hypothetical protein